MAGTSGFIDMRALQRGIWIIDNVNPAPSKRPAIFRREGLLRSAIVAPDGHCFYKIAG